MTNRDSGAPARAPSPRVPEYILMMRDAVASTPAISRLLRADVSRSRISPNILENQPTNADDPLITIFSKLNVIAADLTPSQKAILDKSEDVVRIVANQKRQVPRFVSAGGSDQFSSSLSWALDAIGLSEDYSKASGRGVNVAILDTGVNLGHPDFAGKAVNAETFVPLQPVHDQSGHGTHCAGIICGPRSSVSRTRYGVAPDVNLLVGKVLADTGDGYDDWILKGIQWAADSQAKIISLSLAGDFETGQADGSYELYEYIAHQLLNEVPGVLIVASAGNSSIAEKTMPVQIPAACSSIFAVSAIDQNGRVANFSCATADGGGTVDIAAPGVDVFSSFTGNTFETLSGTSMAAPHVAGVAALYLEVQPWLSARELRANILAGVRRIPAIDKRFGAGIVRVP